MRGKGFDVGRSRATKPTASLAQPAQLARLALAAGALLVAVGACGGSAVDGGGGAGAGGGLASGGAPSGGAAQAGTSAGGKSAAGNSTGGAALAGSSGAPATGGNAGTNGGSGSAGGGNGCDSSKTCCATSRCGCPYPAGDGVSNVISDLDDWKTTFSTAGNTAAKGYWDLSKDASQGTISPNGTATLMSVTGGANGTSNALHVTGSNLTGWGASLAAIVGNGCPFDASKYGGFSFYAKGTSSVLEGKDKLLVLVGNPDYIPNANGGFCDEASNPARCYARHRVLIALTGVWKQYVIAWEDLQPAPYGDPLPFGANRVRDIVFSAPGPAKPTDAATGFDIWIDQLAFVPMGTKGNL